MTPRSLLAPARLAGQPVLRTQSDERLVDLVRAGSEPAFEAIVGRHRRSLLRYCARLLGEERAEDAVQQTFVRAFDSMRESQSELKLRPWLYRIAHNTALNALRDRGLRHEPLEEGLDGVERPDQALERAHGLRTVLAAVQELPQRQRDAILLRELEGRSYDEIAAALGVTGGAVRQLLNRARNNLRAAATAAIPAGPFLRIPWAGAGDSMSARVAELCGLSGAGTVAKACATALVTGALAGGAAVIPEEGGDGAAGSAPDAIAAVGPSGKGSPRDRLSGGLADLSAFTRGSREGERKRADDSGRRGRDDHGDPGRSGPGGRHGEDGDEDRDEGDDGRSRRGHRDTDGHDRSGHSGGDDEESEQEEDSSGPGSGGERAARHEDDGSSGPGSGSSGGGSGSDGGSSGSGSGFNGSDSGSGSGSSGSGSGDEPQPG